MTKKSFLLMRDLLATVDLMTDEEAGQILKSIINHVDGKQTKLNRELTFAFTPIKNQLDRDMGKYDVFVEKQRVNGAKGGRPRNNPKNPSLSKKTQKTQRNPKNLVTDTVTVNATETETDTVTATVNETIKDLNMSAFNKYIAYRKESGIKKLTPHGEQLAAKKLISLGASEKMQMDIVEQSIGNGWAGLFELKQPNNKKQNRMDTFNQWIDSDDDYIDGECDVIN